MSLAGDLCALGVEATDGASVLDLHAGDLTYHRPVRPDAVAFPRSTAEVSALLAWANEQGVAVTPFGAGTSLEGHVVPLRGGISLDLTRMDRIREVRPEDLLAVVEPGVTRGALNARVAEHGLEFPVDPGADASLGGMAATNASGTTTVRHGGMRANVLAIEVVLADGRVVRTGSRAVKSSAGYGLTGLFVGSEGTLGVITELTLRLYGIPEYAVAARISLPSIEAVCRLAATMRAGGLALARAELLDAATMAAVNAYEGTVYAEAPTLFLELAGSRAAAESDLELARELAEDEGALAVDVETDPTARSRLWAARHHAALSVAALAPGKKLKGTDVCVPVSELAEAVRHARAAADARGVAAAIIGHAGDGNYHLVMTLDPDDPDELAAAEEVGDEIVRWALERGGTCTGEHGIGLGKIAYLEAEHGDAIPFMRGLKQLADPNGILNPGKVLPA